MKVLVAGWFSFEQMGASAGDLLSRDLVCQWLERCGREYDVALAAPFVGGVEWRRADPAEYSDIVFVCGPFGNGPPLVDFLKRFSGCRLVGLNLTMLEPLEIWNPFDLLLERDSSSTARPDLAFLTRQALAPVVGVVLIDQQPEYRSRDLHRQANEAIERLLSANVAVAVRIDTRLDENSSGLRTPGEIESLIARMDLILTTRLHGLVLALKNGVPALALDPVAGGGKVSRQAEVLGWQLAFPVESASDAVLQEAFRYCQTDDAHAAAGAARDRAIFSLRAVEQRFLEAFPSSYSNQREL